MTYQVLARKWRPRSFAEMVGQEHVLKALINALDNDRLHHAFLFTGTRGVGKTTIARILAKSLNCDKGIGSTPCGECNACKKIDEGRFVDLIEVDAASRTKVDDTRELLDNVQYTPTRGRYKVYLIDEVHMLSNHSFNALLKTLEEPPPHVKFLLATTDPQKLPVTILSRCLQFNLKRLPRSLIEQHLNRILNQENINFEANAVALLARAADGSMRDALSLLDQAIPFGGGELLEQDVRDMIGAIESRHVLELLTALAEQDAAKLMAVVSELDSQAPDYSFVTEELATGLQKIAMLQVAPSACENWDDREALAPLAETLSPEDAQLFYQIAITGRRDLALAPDGRGGFEMLLLRMLAFRPVTDVGPLNVSRASKPQAVPAAAKQTPRSNNTSDVASRAWAEPNWIELVEELGLRGAAHQLAVNCHYMEREGNIIKLRLGIEHKQLMTDNLVKRIAEALSKCFAEELTVKVDIGEIEEETPAQREARKQAERMEKARSSIENDPNVKALQDMLGAEIRMDTIKPVD